MFKFQLNIFLFPSTVILLCHFPARYEIQPWCREVCRRTHSFEFAFVRVNIAREKHALVYTSFPYSAESRSAKFPIKLKKQGTMSITRFSISKLVSHGNVNHLSQ